MRISDWSSDVCSSDLADVRAVADPTADRQRDIDLPCDRFDGLEQRRPIIHRRGDVEKHQLIRTLRVVLARDLDWIAGVLHVLELDALDHATAVDVERSEEHTSELQSLMRISYAVFCLKKKTTQ